MPQAASTPGYCPPLTNGATRGTADPLALPLGSAAWLRAATWLLLLAPCWVVGGQVLVQGWRYAQQPWPTCQTEILIADGIRSVAQGEPLYPAIQQLPFKFRIYHPLTFFPAGLAARWLHLTDDQLWFAGRVLPLASALVLLLVLAAYVRRQTGRAEAPLAVAGLVLFFHTATLTDFFRNRPETPALACTLIGWCVAQRRTKGWEIRSALCCVLALAFKQSYLAAPAAIALQLAAERNVRSLLRFAACGILAGAAVIGGSWYALGDGYWQHTFQAMAADPVHPWQASAYFYPILITRHWGPLTVAALVALPRLFLDRRHHGLLIYLATCTLWTSWAHGKHGADLNYHGELSLLVVLAVTLALYSAGHRATRLRWVPAAILLLLMAAIWRPVWAGDGLGMPVSTHRLAPEPGPFRLERPFGDVSSYVARYRADRGRILIFDAEIAYRVGEPALLDWLTVRLLLDAGQLDFDLLRHPIESHAFRRLVFERGASDRWISECQRVALQAGYRCTWSDQRLNEWTAP